MVRLAEYLDVPLRERNDLLVAAGHAPQYRETSLDAAELGPVRDSLQLLLTAHEPCPAVVVDRQWNLLLGNRAVQLFTVGVAPHLLEPPANVLRLALHPDGMAARIIGTRPDRDSCLGGWSHQGQSMACRRHVKFDGSDLDLFSRGSYERSPGWFELLDDDGAPTPGCPARPLMAQQRRRLGRGVRVGSRSAGGVKTGWPWGSRWMSHPGRCTSM